MCSIFGAILNAVCNDQQARQVHDVLNGIYSTAFERGRDGRGYAQVIRDEPSNIICKSIQRQYGPTGPIEVDLFTDDSVLIGNMRAEPTTEFVKNKSVDDQQPYWAGDWYIVHNGTIANDKELRTGAAGSTKIDSAAIVDQLHEHTRLGLAPTSAFYNTIEKLKGSFAILAINRTKPGIVYYACNYRPIWYTHAHSNVFFASTRRSFSNDSTPKMITPYTMGLFSHRGMISSVPLRPIQPAGFRQRSLVVCSGGMDSVVSAASVIAQGHEVELVHFQYGSRAEGPEVQSVKRVAEHFKVPLHFKKLPNVWDTSDSPLLQSDSTIAGGEAGAEFAHEWVPARNLVMLAVATAFAEAKGFDNIVLGNNLEEAGAYPDNEPEFIDRFNDLLPFAVGDGKKVQILMPVGNMMKHEIVEYGLNIKAPLHLTWSCYRAGMLHCGTCGPCFMRRMAFEINHTDEVIEYEQ